MKKANSITEQSRISLQVNEIRKIELDILLKIKTICEGNGIHYSLAAGSLLGAIRHQGFIPWDDDVDVIMPRSDYERFVDICAENKHGINVLNCRINREYGKLFTKIFDSSTVLEEETGRRGKYSQGICVDVFPIDGMGKKYSAAVRNFMAVRPCLELLNSANWSKFVRSRTKSICAEPIRFGFFIISRFVSPNTLANRLENRIKRFEINSSNLSGCWCGSYRKKEILSSDVFMHFRKCVFEGHDFECIADYDSYLSNLYGDYMTPPSESARKTHHGFMAYKKEAE